MIQILGLLAINWLLVWIYNKNNLSFLGITLTKKKFKLILVLLIVTGLCCSVTYMMKMYFAKEHYILNPHLSLSLILSALWETLRSVLTEELICRGAILYILIKTIGSKRAIIVSSILFGLLHWLNNGIFGNAFQMALIFAFTFSMGLLLAYSYAKTFSILIPTAIHFGWNLTQNFIFPDQPQGAHLFILASIPPIVQVSYFIFFTLLILPKATAIGLDYLIIKSTTKRESQVDFICTSNLSHV